jgi:ABC-type lipoprotein export system ATPase subunit
MLDAEELAVLRRDKIGFVFQGFNLLPRMDALHNVAMPLGYARVPHGERLERRRGRPPMSASVVTVRALQKIYDAGGEVQVHALRGVSLDIATANNRKLGRIRAHEIGFVFQGFNLIPTLTAHENVDMALEPLGLTKAERTARVTEALAHVGLAERGDHRPGVLSGGQQQRVAIARAIVKRPRVLLADEPTGNLDESMRDEILSVLQKLTDEGLTLIVVTHDSAVARRARRRLRLDKGTVRDITR